MPFTKMARGESAEYRAQYMRDNMHERGWFETRVETWVLDRLGIAYEIGPRETVLGWPKPPVYAPVWVHGIWLRGVTLPILEELLKRARDDFGERELVCTEISLNMGVPRAARHAAQAYADLVRQAASERTPDVPDS